MIKENKFKVLISSILILLPILFGISVWDKLPEKIATHWGADGNPDQYSSKLFAVVFLPLLVFVSHWLCLLFSRLDPKNKGQNKKIVGLVFWICPAVSLLCSCFIYFDAFKVDFNIGGLCILFLGVLFIVIGNYMPKTKQNYTIGIKIIWTLDNEENWNATHRFAGKLWVIGGILMLPAAFLPVKFLPLILIIVLPLTIIPMIYSYRYYKKQNTDKENHNG